MLKNIDLKIITITMGEPKKKKENHTYPYADYILPPGAIGASTAPGALGNDVRAILSYVNVLTTGNSRAQTIAPLGNQYFLDSGGKCKDVAGKEQTRYIYINNIPDNSLGLGQGLIPGILGNMANINPNKIFSAFDEATTCQKINMQIRDIYNNSRNEEKYVCDSDIKYYSPCWFTNRENPVTKRKCNQGLTMRYEMPSDPMFQVYTLSVYTLGAYLLYCLTQK
jgi:hypothetical protein